jgi:hypothetical protein
VHTIQRVFRHQRYFSELEMRGEQAVEALLNPGARQGPITVIVQRQRRVRRRVAVGPSVGRELGK